MKGSICFFDRIRIFSALLALLFVLSGCSAELAVTTSETTSESVTTVTETAEASEGIINFVKDGAPAVRLVVAATSGELEQVAKDRLLLFAEFLKKETGLDFGKYRDTSKIKDEEKDMPEIIFGLTSRDESIAAYNAIAYDECSLTVSGNKILLSAYTEDNLIKVYNAFMNRVRKAKRETGELCFRTDEVFTNRVSGPSGSVPLYSDGKCTGVFDAGGESELILVRRTSQEKFKEYLDLLEEKGFTEYSTNEAAGNIFSVLKNDKFTVNAGFYAYESSARIIVEPLVKDFGLKEDDKDHKIVCEPMITMLGLDTDGSNANGLSVLIRLEDGRFIVIDGGHNSSDNAINLLDEMKRQSADYVSDVSEIEVAAWVITHVHGDHAGMLTHQIGRFSEIKIDRVLTNTISRTALDEAKASEEYKDNFDKSEGTGDTSLMNKLNSAGIYMQRVHTGQAFYIGGAKMEILYSLDSFTPRLLNAFNTTSLVVRFEIAGQTIIITGDATGDAMEICANMYGEYLKCDIASVAHHGYTTWGNNNGMISAYKLMRPSIVLWCQGSKAYPSYKNKSYNKPLFQTEEFREVFVAGERGDYTRLKLPYVPEEQKAAA